VYRQWGSIILSLITITALQMGFCCFLIYNILQKQWKEIETFIHLYQLYNCFQVVNFLNLGYIIKASMRIICKIRNIWQSYKIQIIANIYCAFVGQIQLNSTKFSVHIWRQICTHTVGGWHWSLFSFWIYCNEEWNRNFFFYCSFWANRYF